MKSFGFTNFATLISAKDRICACDTRFTIYCCFLEENKENEEFDRLIKTACCDTIYPHSNYFSLLLKGHKQVNFCSQEWLHTG